MAETSQEQAKQDSTALNADEVMARERRQIETQFSAHFDSRARDYLDQDYRRFVQQGYGDYVREHYPHVDPAAYPHPDRPWYGLALSGGGIRSASFGIGVIQALHNQHLFGAKPTAFDKLAYLSTASGGGYTGTCLSWFQRLYGVFPFGNVRTYAGSIYSSAVEDRILGYIRQHGKYLTPAQLGLPALLGAILLSVFHSVAAYTLIIGLFSFLLTWAAHTPPVTALLSFSIITDNEVNYFVTTLPETLAKLHPRVSIPDPDKISFSALFLSLALLCTVLFLLATVIYGLSSYAPRWFSTAYCYRVKLQAGLGRLLKLIGFCLFFAALPVAAILIFGDDLEVTDPGLFTSMGSGLLGIILGVRNFRQRTEKASSGRGPVNVVVTGAVILVFIFFVFLMAYVLGDTLHDRLDDGQWRWPLLVILAGLILPLVVNINQISPHKMYRDRLMETFLKAPETAPTAHLCQVGREANATLLSDLAKEDTHWSPYHLINCNIILNNARTPRFRGRVGDSFLLSSLYCGSDATGYVASPDFNGGELTLATAMSVSGAAENPHASVAGKGRSVNPFVAFLMTFLGLRLGFWAYSPSAGLRGLRGLMRPNYVVPGIYSLLNFGHAEKSLFAELSDGGHFDNTALYELVRRRTPVIILSDGSADLEFTFNDLGNAIERMRVDFGVSIRFPQEAFDLSGLLPGSKAAVSEAAARIYDDKYALAERGYAIGDIIYPEVSGGKAFIGRFVYIKATLTRNLPGDLYAYKASHPDFASQPTLDQFFDERQFEAYRELGYQLTRQLLLKEEAAALLP